MVWTLFKGYELWSSTHIRPWLGLYFRVLDIGCPPIFVHGWTLFKDYGCYSFSLFVHGLDFVLRVLDVDCPPIFVHGMDFV